MRHSSRIRARSRRLVLVAFLSVAGGLLGEAEAAPVVSIEQGYNATFSNFPMLPDDITEPVTLIVDGASRDYQSTPFDSTHTGVGWDGLGTYSVRVAANSDYGHLRAALQTSFDHYSATNYTTAIYQEGEWRVSIGGNPYIATLDTFVRDGIMVTGGSGRYDATFNFVMHGSMTSSFGYGSSNGTPVPVAVGSMGLVASMGADSNGSAIPLLEDRVFDGDIISFTIHGLQFDTATQITYWLSLSQFTPSSYYEPSLSLTGSVDFDLISTASLQNVVITVPDGTDVSRLNARFSSGAQIATVFQSNTPVPEPGSLTLMALGALGACVASRFRKRLA